MRKSGLAVAVLLAVSTLVSGCGTKEEQAEVGSTYLLTKDWCNRSFNDGSKGMSPGACGAYEGAVAGSDKLIPAGTCLTFKHVNVSYPKFNRTVEYDVLVGKTLTRLAQSALHLPLNAGGIVKTACKA